MAVLIFDDLPDNIREHYTPKQVHKAQRVNSTTIVIRTTSCTKDVWDRRGGAWVCQEPEKLLGYKAPTTLFGQPLPAGIVK